MSSAMSWAVLFVAGLFVDGWAHTHGKVDQSFFTPWHAILYGGWMLTALFFILHALVGHSRGLAWRASLPQGYFPSLIGAVGFGVAGLGDMTWHLIFGIEKGVEALLSPTHLALGITIGLVVSGPLRAAWSRSAAGRHAALRHPRLSDAARRTTTRGRQDRGHGGDDHARSSRRRRPQGAA